MSELLQKVVHAADQRLAEDLVVLDFRGHSPFTDYFVIASAKNERMADSIVDHVIEEAEKPAMPCATSKAVRAAGGC